MDQLPAEALISGLRRVQLVTSFDLAAVTMYAFEYLLTLDMEIRLVWSTNWNWMKVIFLVQRYMPFVDTSFLIMYLKFGPGMNIQRCKELYTASAYLMTLGTAFSELILALRAWAVWNRDPRMTVLLPTAFVACYGSILYFMYRFTTSLRFVQLPHILDSIPEAQCFIVDADRILFMTWVMLMIYNAFIFLVMMIPGYRAYRSGGDSALYQSVYRDGLLYYLWLFALSTLNIIVIKMLPHGYENLLTGMERCMHSIVTSRVLLHIRQLGSNNHRNELYTVHHWSDGVTQLPPVPVDVTVSDGSVEMGLQLSTTVTRNATIVIHREQVVSEKVM